MIIETTSFNVQDRLKTPEERAAYVEAALETGDAPFIAIALGDIALARRLGTDDDAPEVDDGGRVA